MRRAVLPKPTSVCTYDGTPSVTVRTGPTGSHPFGLCAACTTSHDRLDKATEIMDGFRTAMQEAGLLDATVEQFIQEVIVVASAHEDPQAEINSVFRMISRKRAAAGGGQ
ncbi:hypothetical protein [Streptomyces sp. NPDC055210]